MHDKELLAIFKAFKVWHHHLEGSMTPVEVFTDHKNLKYFTSSKMLTHQQAQWSEYLNAFNLSLHFRLGKLGAKPDALTRCWDVYPKEGGVSYAEANPENTRPLFTPDLIYSTPTPPDTSIPPQMPTQASLHVQPLAPPTPMTLLDMEALHSDILAGLASDTVAQIHLENLRQAPPPDSKWSISTTGFLLYQGAVFVPNDRDLQNRVLKACHNHPLAGHLGQTKTLEILHWDYFWPRMHDDMTAFVKSCIPCRQAKAH
jgi:hypothetical protein